MPKKAKIEETEVAEEAVEVSEKDLLKQAEEREKARKEQEEAEKAIAKAEAKEAKAEEREEHIAQKQAVRVKPRHGKKYRAIALKIEADKEYGIDEAIALALETNPAKFDATVELHVKAGVKEKNIRGIVVMPGGVTKEKKVLAVTEANVEEVVAAVKAGKADFDIMVADIKLMPKIASLAKILGPKGLMPSPKAGTAVENVEATVAELAGGRVEYRADKTNIVHIAIGKISFGADRIKQNYQVIMDHMPRRIDSIHLTTSMGPSIKVSKK